MRVIDAVRGEAWVLFSYVAVLPKFGSWLAPLAAVAKRAPRRRHGSRGAKRRRRSVSVAAVDEADDSL